MLATEQLEERMRSQLLQCSDYQLARIIGTWVECVHTLQIADLDVFMIYMGYKIHRSKGSSVSTLITPRYLPLREKVSSMNSIELGLLSDIAYKALEAAAKEQSERYTLGGNDFLRVLIKGIADIRETYPVVNPTQSEVEREALERAQASGQNFRQCHLTTIELRHLFPKAFAEAVQRFKVTLKDVRGWGVIVYDDNTTIDIYGWS